MHTFEDRVIACFKGLATGDAIGKQTEMLSYSDVRRWYPGGVGGFEGRPGDVIPRYRGKKYEWRVGETTDDTEQTLAVARAVLHVGEARHEIIGEELLRCKKSVHPGVSLWEFQQRGDPSHVALQGDGCGAAMRVASIAVRHASFPIPQLVEAAYQSAVPTHGGQLGICAAAAVAAAIATALVGGSNDEVFIAAVDASREAETLRPQTAAFTMSEAIRNVHSALAQRSRLVPEEIAEGFFPTSSSTIVPLAISLALLTGSADTTMLLAANIGGDADSVASIGGAIAGALNPSSVNEIWFQTVNSTEDLDVIEMARALAAKWPRR